MAPLVTVSTVPPLMATTAARGACALLETLNETATIEAVIQMARIFALLMVLSIRAGLQAGPYEANLVIRAAINGGPYEHRSDQADLRVQRGLGESGWREGRP